MATQKSFEFMKKPHQHITEVTVVSGDKDTQLLEEVEKYKKIAEEYKQKNMDLEKEVEK